MRLSSAACFAATLACGLRESHLREADDLALFDGERRHEAAVGDLARLDVRPEVPRALQVHVVGRVVRAECIAERTLRDDGERWRIARDRAAQRDTHPGRALRRRFRNTSISFAAWMSPASRAAAMPRS